MVSLNETIKFIVTISKSTLRMRAIACLSFLFFSLLASGQVTLQPKQMETTDVGVVYNKEFAVNVYLHTKGYGVGAIFGDIQTYYKTSFYHIDLGLVKHPKEHRPDQIPQGSILTRPYIYGKKNTFMVLRAGKGMKRYLSEKAKRKGVAMAYSFQVGPSIGMLKPYYLDLDNTQDGVPSTRSEKYSAENHDRFLNTSKIEGYSGFWRGLDEINFILGGHIKGGAHFAWGAYDKYVKAIEVGLLLDVYFQRVDIMVIEDNSPLFANLYINLQFGKRK